jgi:hypothetical protein
MSEQNKRQSIRHFDDIVREAARKAVAAMKVDGIVVSYHIFEKGSFPYGRVIIRSRPKRARKPAKSRV